jgi:hypothetical protein
LRFTGYKQVSIFEEDDLDSSASLIRQIMTLFKESQPADKFNLFESLKELFQSSNF